MKKEASTQFSISNGTSYVASNLQMSNTAVTKAADGSLIAAIDVTPDGLRFYTTSSNGVEKLVVYIDVFSKLQRSVRIAPLRLVWSHRDQQQLPQAGLTSPRLTIACMPAVALLA